MKKCKLLVLIGLLHACPVIADGIVDNPWPGMVKSPAVRSGGQAGLTGVAQPIKRGGEGKSIAAEPMTPFADTRLVLYHYDPDLTYGVKTKDGLYTHIEIEKGDAIKGFYLSDSTKWKFHVSGDKQRIFIKPTIPGEFTAATLITNKRVYEMTFAAVRGNDDWYQRVTWDYPSSEEKSSGSDASATGIYEDAATNEDATSSTKKKAGEQVRVGPQFDEPMPVGTVDPAKMSFGYTVSGDGLFKPVTVFDDGRFTWLRFDKKMQDMPALFLVNEDGKAEILNYTTHGDYILISRLVSNILLRLGKQEVKITKAVKSCGLFGC